MLFCGQSSKETQDKIRCDKNFKDICSKKDLKEIDDKIKKICSHMTSNKHPCVIGLSYLSSPAITGRP